MSPKTLDRQSVLTAVSEESFGFRFGKPDRPSEKSLACILPILRETSQQRQYVTMPETDQILVMDSGTIYKVNLKNASKQNVFVRSGTIFEGKGTQSRALTRSAVLFPGTEVALDVRCVHQSHSIRPGAKFQYGGVTPLSVDASFYTAGYRPSDQQTMWNAVRRTTTAWSGESDLEQTPLPAAPVMAQASAQERSRGVIPRLFRAAARPEPQFGAPIDAAPAPSVAEPGAFVGSDDLKRNFDSFARDFDSILSKARLHENQSGLALITETGCKTIELFDVPASWEALHKDAVKRMGTELLRGSDNTNVFEYKPENAVNAARKVLGLNYKTNLIYEHKPSNGEPHVAIFGMSASNYVGEIVELDGRVIHLVILETAQA